MIWAEFFHLHRVIFHRYSVSAQRPTDWEGPRQSSAGVGQSRATDPPLQSWPPSQTIAPPPRSSFSQSQRDGGTVFCRPDRQCSNWQHNSIHSQNGDRRIQLTDGGAGPAGGSWGNRVGLHPHGVHVVCFSSDHDRSDDFGGNFSTTDIHCDDITARFFKWCIFFYIDRDTWREGRIFMKIKKRKKNYFKGEELHHPTVVRELLFVIC